MGISICGCTDDKTEEYILYTGLVTSNPQSGGEHTRVYILNINEHGETLPSPFLIVPHEQIPNNVNQWDTVYFEIIKYGPEKYSPNLSETIYFSNIKYVNYSPWVK